MLCSKEGFDVLSSDTVVVAPNVGRAKRARNFLSRFSCNTGNELDIAIVNDLCGGSDTLIGQDVNGKVCVITDDIVDSASTLCNAVNILKDRGAEKVYACITHGIFSGDAVKKIENSAIEKLFVTDSNVFDVNGSTKIEVLPLVLFEMINPVTTLVYDLTKKWDVPLANKILCEIFKSFKSL
jgi:ribose-phosphate pyrophosphokinase